MKEPIRVLQVVNIMDRAGLETILMNYYRAIDKSKIQFDFLSHRAEKGEYDDEIAALGGFVYHAPRLYPQNYFSYLKWMKKFFKKHPEYKIVHSHIDSMSFLPLLASKINGVQMRIAHSHNSSIEKDYKYLLKTTFKYFLPFVSNAFFACSKSAGKYLFKNKEFTIIKNAISLDDFLYKNEVRSLKRKELNLSSFFVIGHIGRYNDVKNHDFLIEVFANFLSKKPEAKLLLIGSGENKPAISDKCKKLMIQDNVLFLENRSDINELLIAMDIFILPSKFEGLPVVGIEAQTSDLPCLFSYAITKELEVTSKCRFKSLSDDVISWADELMKMSEIKYERQDNREILTKNGYNICNESINLEKIYIRLHSQIGNKGN